MSKVQIYSTGWCPYSFAAKALLEDKGIAYDEIDVTAPESRADMIQRPWAAHGAADFHRRDACRRLPGACGARPERQA